MLAQRRARAVLSATLVAAAVLSAACGTSDSGGSTGTSNADLSLLGADKAATGTPVKIGFVATGQTEAIDTTDEIKGAQTVVAYANAKLGGLGGHPIQLVTCEEKSIPAQAQACGNQFVAEKVSAVVGGSPGQSNPWLAIVNPAGIPAVLNIASTPAVLGTSNVFVLGNPLASFGTAAAYAREKGLKKVAYVVIDVPAASGAARSLAPAFMANAGGSADVVAVAAGTPDMTPQIQAEQNNSPSMYYVLGDPTFCSSAIKAIRTLGLTAPVTALDRCIGSDGGASIPGGFEGVTFAAQADVDPNDAEFKLYSAVLSQYGSGLAVSGNSESGYQAMLGLVRGFNAAGSTDTSAAGVTAALKSMPATPYPLGGGTKFQCNGTAIPAVSKNICSTAGFIADSTSDGKLSNFRAPDTTGIYVLHG